MRFCSAHSTVVSKFEYRTQPISSLWFTISLSLNKLDILTGSSELGNAGSVSFHYSSSVQRSHSITWPVSFLREKSSLRCPHHYIPLLSRPSLYSFWQCLFFRFYLTPLIKLCWDEATRIETGGPTSMTQGLDVKDTDGFLFLRLGWGQGEVRYTQFVEGKGTTCVGRNRIQRTQQRLKIWFKKKKKTRETGNGALDHSTRQTASRQHRARHLSTQGRRGTQSVRAAAISTKGRHESRVVKTPGTRGRHGDCQSETGNGENWGK